MQTERFYNDPEDCAWLRETALAEVATVAFHSFILHGNEDCPLRVELFSDAMPDYDTTPAQVFVLAHDSRSNLSRYVEEGKLNASEYLA